MKDYSTYLTEKPFSCNVDGCSMKFANADHLTVHKKRHDMILTLGLGLKNSSYIDQTPTPTQFIKNCEEVGLFQDLQNVNPFEETFKKAVEAVKLGQPLCSEKPQGTNSSDDTLHTPNVFPHIVDVQSTHLTEESVKSPLAEDVFIKEEELEIPGSRRNESCMSQETETKIGSPISFQNLKKETCSITSNNVLANAPEGQCQFVQFVTSEIPQTQCNIIVVKNSDDLYSAVPITVKDKLKKNLTDKKNGKVVQQKVPISKWPTKKMQNSLSNKFSNFSRNSLKMIPKFEKPETENCDLNPVPMKKKKKKNDKFLSMESRNEYLARSRAASFRCREKKKMYILYLEKVNIELSTSNQNLQLINISLRNQIRELHAELSKHRKCNAADVSTEETLSKAAVTITENKTAAMQEEKTTEILNHPTSPTNNNQSTNNPEVKRNDISSPATTSHYSESSQPTLTDVETTSDGPDYSALDVAEVILDERKDETEIPLKECNKSSDIIVRFNSVANDAPVQFVPENSFLSFYVEGAGECVRRIYDEHCYFVKRAFVSHLERQGVGDVFAVADSSSSSPVDESPIKFDMDLINNGTFRNLTGLNKKLHLDQRTPPPLILLKPFKKRTLLKKRSDKKL